MNKISVLAWHYTTFEKLVSILQSGMLVPTAVGCPDSERPVLWFSLNQSFEPTAAKGLIDAQTGQRRTATIAEMMTFADGLVRFGVSPKRLLPGEKLRTRARIKREEWAALRRSAFDMRADPALWFGTLAAVEVSSCLVEAMNPVGEWERLPDLAVANMTDLVNGRA